MDPLEALDATDPEIADIVRREVERQNTTIQLIASENFTSPAVIAAQGSVLTNKYSEGYPGKRYYGGNYVVDDAEELARDRACELFGAEHANVQPHSGANANMAAYLALLDPGDKVMGMRLDQGGHLTHGSPVNFSGRLYDFVAYGVDDDTEVLDYDELRELAIAERPKLIVAGATAYPRIIDFAAFREIADEVGALLMVDAAHIAGLIAGGAHPSPRAVRRRRHLHHPQDAAWPACGRDPVPRAVRRRHRQGGVPRPAGRPAHARGRGQGGRLPRGGAARLPRLRRRDRAQRRAPSPTALASEGFRIVSGGTDNHLMLVDLRPFGVTGKVAQEALDRAGITLQQERDPERPGEAVRHQRAAARHRRGHHRGHGASRRWQRSPSLIATVLRNVDDEGTADDDPRRRRPPVLEVHPVPRARRPVGTWVAMR